MLAIPANPAFVSLAATHTMDAVVFVTRSTVTSTIEARGESPAVAAKALASALGIPFSTDGRYDTIEPRAEILLELYYDAFETARTAGLSPEKIATYLNIHQRLVHSLPRSLSSRSGSRLADSRASGSERLGGAPAASDVLNDAKVGSVYEVLTTVEQAGAEFERLMRASTISAFSDPDTDSKFTLHDLSVLVS